jgi:purine-cytosine permease-like protein
MIGLVFSFIGLRAVLKYEEYAWAVFFVIFMIIFGEAGSKADNKTPTELVGLPLVGSCLSLIAVVYGSSASWCSIVSDCTYKNHEHSLFCV